MKKGIAELTLDYGKAPKWLFEKMVKLAREISIVLIEEFGPDEFVKRLADPVWFQSLGVVLAFDWNASGLTTVLTASLKKALNGLEKDLGVFICGGKGKTSRKTPEEIKFWGNYLNFLQNKINSLVYSSKMSAKVDNALLQDGYQLYHHSFFFTKNGVWTVVQQGKNVKNQTARRYHWYSENISDFIQEPHTGIISEILKQNTLDLTSSKSANNREVSLELVSAGFKNLIKDIKIIRKYSSKLLKVLSFKYKGREYSLTKLKNKEFHYHQVLEENFWQSKYLEKILMKLTSEKPKSYEEILSVRGVGAKTMRALSLISEIIYGANPSYKDPARYSFAHGGKDSTPYPVDTKTYDKTIEIMQEIVRRAKLQITERDKILKKLTNSYYKVKLTS